MRTKWESSQAWLSESMVARLAFLTPNFTNLAFLKAVGVKNNCLAFWLFLCNIWLFWRQFAHAVTLVFWIFKYLAEKPTVKQEDLV